MNIVTYDEYNSDKIAFFKRHDNDFELQTEGTSAEYYRKTYSFSDEAVWYEVSRKVYIPIEQKVRLVDVKIDVELLETEYYNSQESESKYYYEKWSTDHL